MVAQKQKSQKAFITYLMLSILPSSVKFLLLPIYVNYLSPADYGVLSILSVFAASYGIIGCLQLNIASSVNYFKVGNKVEFEKTIFSSSLLISAGTFLVFLLLGVTLLRPFFEDATGSFYPLGLMSLSTAFLGQVQLVFFVFLRNKYHLKALSFYSILLMFTSTVLQFVLIVFLKFSVFGSLMGSLGATALVSAIIILKNSQLLTFTINKPVLKAALAVSLPMIPAVFIDWVMKFSDRVFLERLMSLEDLGIYTVLANIFILVSTISVSFATSIKPMLYTHFEDVGKNKQAIESMISSFIKIILLALSGVILIGSNLSLILQQEKYLSIVPYFALAGITAIPNLIIQIPHLEMLYSNKSKRISQATLIGAIAQIVLLFVLIPMFKINGVLMAIGLAGLIHLGIAYSYFHRSKVPHALLKNSVMMLLFIALIFTFKLARDTFEFSYNIFGLGQFLIFAIGMAMVSKREISQLYQLLRTWKRS